MSMPAQMIRPAREEYDKMTDNFFKKRLQRKIKPQKVVLMERTLQKYSLEQRRQEEIAAKEKRETQVREIEAKAQKRKAELNKLQRNAGFMDEWLEKGLKEWRGNMFKKKTREKEDEKFKLKQTEFHLSKMQTKKQETKQDTYSEIQSFEKRLTQSPNAKRQKLKPMAVEGEDEAALLAESVPGSPSRQRIAPIPKETKYKQVQYNKEREQRRRKMLMDQSKMQRELEAKRREDELIEKMNRLSRQEQELEYEAWRTSQCKAVVTEDRKLREARYHKREDLDTEVAMIREEEALTALRAQLDRNGEIERERAELYTVARKQSKRNDNAMECQEFFNLMFDLADEAFRQQQTVDAAELDPRNWREWTQLFVEKLPMAANSPGTYSVTGSEVAVPSKQAFDAANARLDYLELLDYLQSAYQWARGEGMKKPAEEGVAELKLINNFELGNAVRTLIGLNYPPQKKADRSRLSLDVKLKLAIIGYAYGGKKTQSKLLADKHGIALIKVEDLIEEALKSVEEKQDEVEAASPKEEGKSESKKEDIELKRMGGEIRQDILAGREVSDIHCVQLIVHRLQQMFGFLTGAEFCAQTKQALLKQPHKAPVVPILPVTKVENGLEIKQEAKHEEEKKEVQVEKKPEEKVPVAPEEKKPESEAKKEPSVPAPAPTVDSHPEIKEENQEFTLPAPEPGKSVPGQSEAQKVKGFILVDFPSTLNQAKLLEGALSGYVCPSDREVALKETLLSEAEVLAKPTPLAQPPQELIQSGLDTVFWLKTSKEECIRRAFGLKKDVKNDTTYHVLNNPPPTANGDVIEKLQPPPDSELINAMLTDRHIAFEIASSSLMKWLKTFGDAKRGMCLLQEIETPAMVKDELVIDAANQNVNAVHTLISNVVGKVLEARNDEERAFNSGITDEIHMEEMQEAARLDYEQRGMIFEEELARKLIEEEKKAAAEEEEGEEEEAAPPAKEEKNTDANAKETVPAPESVVAQVEAKIPSEPQIEDAFKRMLRECNKIK